MFDIKNYLDNEIERINRDGLRRLNREIWGGGYMASVTPTKRDLLRKLEEVEKLVYKIHRQVFCCYPDKMITPVREDRRTGGERRHYNCRDRRMACRRSSDPKN